MAGCTLACRSLPGPVTQSSHEEESPRRMSIAAVGAIFIVPVIAKQASLCNLLTSLLLSLYVSVGHQTVEPQGSVGLIAMVYVQYTSLVLDPEFYQMCPYKSRKTCRS
jgi:hypothetical protein